MPRLSQLFFVAIVLLWAAAVFGITLAKHRLFLYRDFDLAIFAQITDGALRGQWYSSIRGAYGFGDHSSLVLLLIAPLFAIARTPLTLLALQTFALAFAAWQLYVFASRRLRHALLAFAAATAFLLQPAMLFLALFQFHPEVFAVPALVMCGAGLVEHRARFSLLGAALALSTREDAFLPVLTLGVLALFRRETRTRIALPLIAMSLASAALSFAVLKPWLSSGEAEYGAMYRRWGHSPIEIVLGFMRDPVGAISELFSTPGDALDSTLKRQYWLHLFVPLAGLPLLGPGTLLAALPVWAEHLLSSRGLQHTIAYQYTALVLPILGLASVAGLRRVERRFPSHALQAIGALLVVASVGAQLAIGPLVEHSRWRAHDPEDGWPPTFADRQLARVRAQWIQELPRHGVVVSEFAMLSRLATRDSVHSLHHVARGLYTFSSRAYPPPHPVRALFADASDPSMLIYFDERGQQRLSEWIADEDLRLSGRAGDLLRFEPGPAKPLEWPCRTLASDSGKWIHYEDPFDFGGGSIESRTLRPGESLRVRTRWRVRPGLSLPILTQWIVKNGSGRTIVDHTRLLGYGFDPPSRWPSGAAREEEYEILLPDDLPPGPLRVELILGVRDREFVRPSLTSDPTIAAAHGRIDLGTVEVVSPAHR